MTVQLLRAAARVAQGLDRSSSRGEVIPGVIYSFFHEARGGTLHLTLAKYRYTNVNKKHPSAHLDVSFVNLLFPCNNPFLVLKMLKRDPPAWY